jgi:hypothetical protein
MTTQSESESTPISGTEATPVSQKRSRGRPGAHENVAKVVKVKKTVMKIPDSSTIQQVMEINNIPKERYNTVYQRIQILVKRGELVELASIKKTKTKGRGEVVYSRPDVVNADDSNLGQTITQSNPTAVQLLV